LSDRERYWGFFKFTSLGLEILFMAIVGYFIGKQFDMEVEGAALGAILGTVLMWYYIYVYSRRIEKAFKRGG